MIPLGVDTPTSRRAWVILLLLGLMGSVWLLVQGAGFDVASLASSVCNLGLVPGEITRAAPIGTAVPLGEGMVCVVDAAWVNYLTPFTSLFLHGSWAHIVGNGLFLWVFGQNVEDRLGRLRFLLFYLLCGLLAGAAQVAFDPISAVPMVGASGAISGVMGAYLVLYPRARVNMLFVFLVFVRVIALPAWIVLLYWFGIQLLAALPQLAGSATAMPTGVAVMAHIGGFLAGVLWIKPFENRRRNTPKAPPWTLRSRTVRPH
jgi:membrane associated rhomboid family serine protease